jgi:hypothetical protein
MGPRPAPPPAEPDEDFVGAEFDLPPLPSDDGEDDAPERAARWVARRLDLPLHVAGIGGADG